MKGNFDQALARVLVYEGGYSNNPKDPGGATMKGITQGTYNSWRARQGLGSASVANIKDSEVAAIYKMDYWDRIHGDKFPAGVDFCVFDAAVNSGVGGATKWAQAVVGITVDGDMGPKTESTILEDDPEDFIRSFCAHRLGTLQRLPTWSTFGKGWSARVANVQKTALAWAASAYDEAPDAAQVSTISGNAKARTADVPVSKTSTLITHAGTMGGVIATGAAQAGQSITGLTDTFQWVKYVLGGLTLAGAVGGLIVYFSKQANEAAALSVRKATVDPDADAEVPTTPIPSSPPATEVSVTQATVVTGDVTATTKTTEVKTNG